MVSWGSPAWVDHGMFCNRCKTSIWGFSFAGDYFFILHYLPWIFRMHYRYHPLYLLCLSSLHGHFVLITLPLNLELKPVCLTCMEFGLRTWCVVCVCVCGNIWVFICLGFVGYWFLQYGLLVQLSIWVLYFCLFQLILLF